MLISVTRAVKLTIFLPKVPALGNLTLLILATVLATDSIALATTTIVPDIANIDINPAPRAKAPIPSVATIKAPIVVAIRPTITTRPFIANTVPYTLPVSNLTLLSCSIVLAIRSIPVTTPAIAVAPISKSLPSSLR